MAQFIVVQACNCILRSEKKSDAVWEVSQELPKYKWCQGSSGVAAQRLASWSPPHHLAREQGGWGPAEGTPSPGHQAPPWGQG